MIVAHPSVRSFTHASAEAAVTGLRSAGHEVDVIDLYALGVTSAMSAEEHRAYESDSPVLDPLLVEHVALVRRAQALVFVYPTWWSSLPAILKGWLERVMVPGVGFILDDKRKVRPGMTHLRHIVGISSYGSPRLYVRAVNDNGRRILTRLLRLHSGWTTRTHWFGLYAIDTCSAADRAAHLSRIESAMKALR